MSRQFTVAAAQMGPVARADTRSQVVDRLIAMLHTANQAGATLVVFPELALTTFFPRWVIDDPEELGQLFRDRDAEQRDPAALRRCGPQAGMGSTSATLRWSSKTTVQSAISIRPSSSIARGRSPGSIARFTSPVMPSHSPAKRSNIWRSRYFEPGDLGFPVFRSMDGVMGMCICNDRRWPETYRVMGLQGVELVMLGYNTPSTNPFAQTEAPHLGMFHNHLTMQAGAYQNGTWVVASAKAGMGGGGPPYGRKLHHRADRGDRGPGPDRGRRGGDSPDRSGPGSLYPRDHLQLRRTPADRALPALSPAGPERSHRPRRSSSRYRPAGRLRR